MKKYLHYIHIDKKWFYWFDDSGSNKEYRPYYGDGNINKNYICFAGNNTTKSQAKRVLKSKFSEYIPVLTYPYHKGSKIGTRGSRPIKLTKEKDNYREIRKFLNQRSGRQVKYSK